MATALKKLLETAKDMYANMEKNRWGTAYALPKPKLFVLEQLLLHPTSDQTLIDMIDLNLEKGAKVDLEVMKMSLSNTSLEKLLKIIKNCALANTNQLSIEAAKVENEKLLESLTKINSLFNPLATNLLSYDTNNEFILAIDAMYAEISAKQQSALWTYVEPVNEQPIKQVADFDEAQLHLEDIKGLKKIIIDLDNLNDALKYSHQKKYEEITSLVLRLTATIEETAILKEKIKNASDLAQQQSAQMADLQLNLEQAQIYREEQKKTAQELHQRINQLEITLRTTSFNAADEIAALQSQLFELQETLVSKEETQESRVKSLLEEIDSLTHTNQSLIAQLKTAKTKMQEREKCFAAFQAEAKETLASTAKQNSDLQSQVDTQFKLIDEKNAAFDAIQADLAGVVRELRELQQAQARNSAATRLAAEQKSSSSFKSASNPYSFSNKNKKRVAPAQQEEKTKDNDSLIRAMKSF